MLRSCIVAIAATALLGVACERKPADETAYRTPSATAEPAPTAAERDFMQQAAKGNESEVEMAKLAQDKSPNTDVRALADQLEDDHSDVLEELRRIAGRADVTLDTTPPAEQASIRDHLNTMTGKAFDRAWVDHMIEKHRASIASLEGMQNTATGELKAFIDKTLPVVREHLQKLEELSKKVA